VEIRKRTGEAEVYNGDKIAEAIKKAMLETESGVDVNIIAMVVENVANHINGGEELQHVEEIQDEVERQLMVYRPDVAKAYIMYRAERTKARERGWEMNELQRSIWENKYRYEDETFEEWLERVSGGNQRIKKRMRNKEFLFGGRILSNRGLYKRGRKVTYSNCYVLKSPEDNLESIFDTARNMARTYSYGGGVGISLRNLRPRNAVVHNNARTTSGSVSFMPIYSLTTETIGQNGRRGALMLSIPSKHPDLEEFIDVKTSQGSVTGANISIEIDNEFMIAVEQDTTYQLRFEVEDTGEVIEREVRAKELYTKLVRNNWDWAEPGMLFWDRISNYHFMSNDPEFEFAGTNPCAEEPLPAGGSCLLGSLNLSEFVAAPFTEHAYFDFPRFAEAVNDATVALNEVLDEGLPLHPLQEQRESVGELRQIGLGVMGISEMLIKMGITYGSTKSLMLNEIISHFMLNEAVKTSAQLAEELGTFGRYNWKHIEDSLFFQQNLSPDVKELVKEKGLRNSQILCIAPTGSISTMLGVSGGIEPTFALSFNRTTKSLHGKDVTYKVYAEIVKEYYEAMGLEEGAELPEYFVTSHTLDWKTRIEMQAVWQKHIDASISSTVNLPKEISVEETMDLYLYAWKMGLKGCTIYRDGCKRSGILTLDEPEEEKEEEVEHLERATGYYATCPECESPNMVVSGGCVTCQDCGFSPC
jgi:ribonucleoside-diphosphate reductase alpha chain